MSDLNALKFNKFTQPQYEWMHSAPILQVFLCWNNECINNYGFTKNKYDLYTWSYQWNTTEHETCFYHRKKKKSRTQQHNSANDEIKM